MVHSHRNTGLIMALLPLLWIRSATGQCVFRSNILVMESFSSLATVGGLAHASGMELTLSERGNRVEAVLRDYVGEERVQETRLVGSIEETRSDGVTSCEVRLAGKGRYGPINIRGVITPAGFQGTLERHVGHDTFSQRISLKRRLSDETQLATG